MKQFAQPALPAVHVEEAAEAAPRWMVTACSQIEPEGRFVFHSHLTADPAQSCSNLDRAENVSMNCGDGSDASGIITTHTEQGVQLWTCLVRDMQR